MAKNRIFLGGTCNNTTWRDELIKSLKVDYFNPVVKDWTPAAQEKEYEEKENKCNVHLYVITNKMKGVFSIAEAIDSVHNKKVDTILLVMPDGFEDHEMKSLDAVISLVNLRGGMAFKDDHLKLLTRYLNEQYA